MGWLKNLFTRNRDDDFLMEDELWDEEYYYSSERSDSNEDADEFYLSETENVILTIDENHVVLPLPSGEIGLFFPGRVEDIGFALSGCGMQDGVLQLLLRAPDKPFTVDVAICFDEENNASLILGGVGPNVRTIQLTKIA